MRDFTGRRGWPALLAVLLGCSGGGEQPSGADLVGSWESTASERVLSMELRQAGSHVTGRAALARAEYEVRGFIRGAELTLSLIPDASGDAIPLSGTLSGDTLHVRLDGGGVVPLVRMGDG